MATFHHKLQTCSACWAVSMNDSTYEVEFGAMLLWCRFCPTFQCQHVGKWVVVWARHGMRDVHDHFWARNSSAISMKVSALSLSIEFESQYRFSLIVINISAVTADDYVSNPNSGNKVVLLCGVDQSQSRHDNFVWLRIAFFSSDESCDHPLTRFHRDSTPALLYIESSHFHSLKSGLINIETT